MKKWLYNMIVYGGGDCLEMVFIGIVNGKILFLLLLIFCLYMYLFDWYYYKDIYYLNV